MTNSKTHSLRWALVVCLVFVTTTALAQLPIPPSSQFDIDGLLQEATHVGGVLGGGTLTVNGLLITVPANTIVILPANALTWEELFLQAPPPYGPTQSGMAMKDIPAPLTTWEVHVVGNRVGDTYIAGLIDIAQNSLNSGAGFINFIDYALGEIRVGGVLGTPTGARVRINDPLGRYGLATTSPDVRWTVDPDNPTIMAATGYPMCLPRSAPAGAVTADLLCPEENRPLLVDGSHAASFTTNNLSNPSFPISAAFPNSTFQAPFEIGDYVFYSGTMVQDCAVGPTCLAGGTIAGPYPVLGAASTWISAHTIVNNIAIFTFPGSNPAYIETEVTLMGTGGLTVLGVGEAVVRTRFEGMTTDPSRFVHLYGMDLTAAGVETDRDWGTIGVDPGPPIGAVKGRWRFRPPCLPAGSTTTKPDRDCIMNSTGTFLPPTREMRAVLYDPITLTVSNPGNASTAANGLIYGQYHAPILEYIFPENIPGTPIVENNFNSIPFLACGGYTSSAGTLASQLSPWPSNVIPSTTSCVGFVAPPTAVSATATPSAVISGSGTLVTLSATASGTAPLTFTWTQNPTDTTPVTLSATGATATFTAPAVTANTTLNFIVTVTNSAGSASAAVTVTVTVDTPVVNHVAAFSVTSGVQAVINITGVDPGGLPLTFTVTQIGGPAPNLAPLTVTQNPPSGATATFTHALALGAPAVTLQFSIVATNTAGAVSAAEFTAVTVNPQVDSVVITSAEYRTGKQRLIITATSSVISPLVNLFLNSYVTTSGATYNPDPVAGGQGNLFTNNGGGLYTITVVGAPEPAIPPATPLTVRSSLGGVSAPTALTRIRP